MRAKFECEHMKKLVKVAEVRNSSSVAPLKSLYFIGPLYVAALLFL